MLASVSAAMSTSLLPECGDPEVAEQYPADHPSGFRQPEDVADRYPPRR